HSYDVRHLPEWQGTIKYVATTLKGVQGSVKEPTLSNTIDIFLEPQRITPSTINFLTQHMLFGWSWTSVLLAAFLVLSICFLAFRKKLVFSGALGFVAAWTLMDARSILDHATIVYKQEKLKQSMPPLDAIKSFSDQASAMIGRSTWGHGPIDPLSTSFLRYR